MAGIGRLRMITPKRRFEIDYDETTVTGGRRMKT